MTCILYSELLSRFVVSGLVFVSLLSDGVRAPGFPLATGSSMLSWENARGTRRHAFNWILLCLTA